MRMIVATGNKHKLEEFQRILEPLGIEAVSPKEVGTVLDVEENGTTFAENARIKARALHEQTGLAVVADDSGICVDALGGAPGVYSARYKGENTPHSEKIAALLEELRDVPHKERTARFVAAICCILADGTLIECEGVCEGFVGFAPEGAGGFGYDPVFFMEDGRSFGTLSAEEKDERSHRGRALRALAQQLRAYAI